MSRVRTSYTALPSAPSCRLHLDAKKDVDELIQPVEESRAAGRDDKRFWPQSEDYDYEWPDGVLNQQRVKAFIEFYAAEKYERCNDGKLEPDYEKVAIYAHGNTPKHAAAQLASGKWASKLGDGDDIWHDDPGVVAGGEYGAVAIYMRRKRAGPGAVAQLAPVM